MKRKDFISALIPVGGVLSSMSLSKDLDDPEIIPTHPPYLKKGDCIGITSPAGYISMEDILPAISIIKEWGFEIKCGATIGKKDFTYGGTDDERLADLQQMLDDKNIKAIMCARGGYGIIRIIDKIDFKKFVAHPKWMIGFSDATIMHCHINRNYGIASIHSKMCNSFPEDWQNAEQVQKTSIESIRQCLSGDKMNYNFSINTQNKTGISTGVLIGGNAKTLETLAGTKSDINTKNKILFIEDTGEYLYSIDRMFWNLKRTGKLALLKGIIVGGFKIKKDDEGFEFGKTIEEIVLEKVNEYKYPVCFDFPVGHQKNNVALKCGVLHKLIVQNNECFLTEIR